MTNVAEWATPVTLFCCTNANTPRRQHNTRATRPQQYAIELGDAPNGPEPCRCRAHDECSDEREDGHRHRQHSQHYHRAFRAPACATPPRYQTTHVLAYHNSVRTGSSNLQWSKLQSHSGLYPWESCSKFDNTWDKFTNDAPNNVTDYFPFAHIFDIDSFYPCTSLSPSQHALAFSFE